VTCVIQYFTAVIISCKKAQKAAKGSLHLQPFTAFTAAKMTHFKVIYWKL